MGVICIIGVVAALALGGFKRHVNASKTSEATMVLQAIRVAEESYRAENQVYLNVTSTLDSNAGWFPNGSVHNQKSPFAAATHTDAGRWQRLNPPVDRPVQFGYKANAGMAGDAALRKALQLAIGDADRALDLVHEAAEAGTQHQRHLGAEMPDAVGERGAHFRMSPRKPRGRRSPMVTVSATPVSSHR